MYTVLKPRGYNANVTVLNTDTSSSITIGKLNPKITAVLEAGGHTFDSDTKLAEWNLEVNKDTAETLVKLTLQMKKPIRDQRKKPEGKIGVEVDAFNLIFGV